MIFIAFPANNFTWHADNLAGGVIEFTGGANNLSVHAFDIASHAELATGYAKQMTGPVNKFAGLTKISQTMLNRRQGVIGPSHGLRK